MNLLEEATVALLSGLTTQNKDGSINWEAGDPWDRDRNKYDIVKAKIYPLDIVKKTYLVDCENGNKWWCLNGKVHREDGPAIIWSDGSMGWYQNGVPHREDGPAGVLSDGEQQWFKNGYTHREDGPAIICPNGDKEWCINGLLHREDGPAIDYSDGTKGWYLRHVEYTEEEWNKRVKKC